VEPTSVGFAKASVKVVNEALRSTKTLANKEIDVIKDDVLEGLTAVVTVRMY
jgi:DNA gyrase subunit B